jgi:hypothetical protein
VIKPKMRLFLTPLLVLLLGSPTLRAEDPPSPPPSQAVESPPAAAAPAAEPLPTAATPAADGTVSVVVPPAKPAEPAGPRGPISPETSGARSPVSSGAAPPPPPGPASLLIAAAFEPLKRPAVAGGGPAVDPAVYARPLPLREAFERSGDRTRRLWVAQAYWKASVAFASLAWAIDAKERLETTGPGGDPYDRAALEVANASATAAVAEAKADLAVAQQELADLARLPVVEPLPWPVDRPLGSPYTTHFDAIFAQRLATGRVRAINRALPMKQESLDARAKAVAAAESALSSAEQDHARGERPVEAVLAAHAALATQRRQFLEVVRGYNTDIAEYVMAVADFSVPDDRFAAMLIGSPSP